MTYRILEGDAMDRLRELEPESVQTCITSPPYWGLRDYGTATWDGGDPKCDHKAGRFERGGLSSKQASNNGSGGDEATRECPKCGATRIDSQIGLEHTPEEYVANLVAVFREVRRVLRADGTLWLNLGDSYAGGGTLGRGDGGRPATMVPRGAGGAMVPSGYSAPQSATPFRRDTPGLKQKDLVGIPWMVAFALRADGWYLRSDIIWAKPNPMPESVTDRPTKAHEYLFLLTKSPRYFYDADAIREEHQTAPLYDTGRDVDPKGNVNGHGGHVDKGGSHLVPGAYHGFGRNKRSVWTVSTQPFPGAHFATFPPKLIEPCILAGSPPKCCGECGAPWERVVERSGASNEANEVIEHGGVPGLAPRSSHDRVRSLSGATYEHVRRGTNEWRSTCTHNLATGRTLVLDPFAGAGTTGVVALRHDRDFIGVELNPDYAQMARNRLYDDAPLLNVEAL